ncbi:MAG: FHA domain-containing protein [Planctomycetota bacterium]|jgi:pSer/pThr/pTyr-binding forkhead associated (FHA) protein|uniref:FHA domain-containing protein n=1 Tax=uncultured Gimesia sp. TaxID=1678688 RepID=UPI002604442A|nr:FHA domain-containing protein [uncultured Gimesia sp.]
MKIYLSVQTPSKKIKSVTLTKTTLVGRASDCDLKLKSDLVSRYHCKIFLTDSVALVHDLGSSNGTFIDGKKLTPKRDTKLAPGCLLSIADVSFRVDYDPQEFVDVGSTINLKSIEALLSVNTLNSVPDDVIPLNVPAEITLPENQPKAKQNKSSDTATIDEYDPDQKTRQNKKTVQFPEIELTDNMEQN